LRRLFPHFDRAQPLSAEELGSRLLDPLREKDELAKEVARQSEKADDFELLNEGAGLLLQYQELETASNMS